LLRLLLGPALALDEQRLGPQEPFELRWRNVPQLKQDVAKVLGRAMMILGTQGLKQLLL
jgi:hypothetical protein